MNTGIPLLVDMPGNIQVTLGVITLIAGVIVYFFQRRQYLNQRFNDCATTLRANNEEAKITSAILLRSFLTRRYYTKDSIHLISALLREVPYGNLQKTLGDGLSFIKNADGQDFQDRKLHDLSIRSRWSIRKEISGRKRPCRLQSFRRVDFYRADITESSFYHIRFDKSVFCESLLCETAFHYCSFIGADFRYADLNKVTFDQCQLEGVDFSKSLHIETVRVKSLTTSSKTPQHQELINYLNKDGVFDKYHKKVVYYPPKNKPNIFLSHLGMMDSQQSNDMRDVKGWLNANYNVNFSDIERKNYRDSKQLENIRNKMSQCNGVIVMAFAYLNVDSGSIHKVKGNTICSIKDASFSSPWLQVETEIARSLDLPCLIFIQNGVQHTGLFDDKLVKNDGKMYMIELRGSTVNFTTSDEQIIKDWHSKVEALSNNSLTV